MTGMFPTYLEDIFSSNIGRSVYDLLHSRFDLLFHLIPLLVFTAISEQSGEGTSGTSRYSKFHPRYDHCVHVKETGRVMSGGLNESRESLDSHSSLLT